MNTNPEQNELVVELPSFFRAGMYHFPDGVVLRAKNIPVYEGISNVLEGEATFPELDPEDVTLPFDVTSIFGNLTPEACRNRALRLRFLHLERAADAVEDSKYLKLCGALGAAIFALGTRLSMSQQELQEASDGTIGVLFETKVGAPLVFSLMALLSYVHGKYIVNGLKGRIALLDGQKVDIPFSAEIADLEKEEADD